MSKEQDKEEKVFERAEIQGLIQPAVEQALKVVPTTADHVRRTVRAGLRVFAKVALEAGCDPRSFIQMAQEAFQKEAGTESLTEAAFVAYAKGPNGAKA